MVLTAVAFLLGYGSSVRVEGAWLLVRGLQRLRVKMIAMQSLQSIWEASHEQHHHS